MSGTQQKTVDTVKFSSHVITVFPSVITMRTQDSLLARRTAPEDSRLQAPIRGTVTVLAKRLKAQFTPLPSPIQAFRQPQRGRAFLYFVPSRAQDRPRLSREKEEAPTAQAPWFQHRHKDCFVITQPFPPRPTPIQRKRPHPAARPSLSFQKRCAQKLTSSESTASPVVIEVS